MGKVALSPATLVRRAALRELADHGPLDEEDLAQRLLLAGFELGEEPEERVMDVLDPERVVELEDGRLVDLLALAEGVVFSHELSSSEIADETVMLHPDLSVLEDLSTAGVELGTATGPLEHDHEGEDGDGCVLVGPAGWLGATASGGDLLTVAVRDGRTTVAVVSEPLPVTPDAVAALRAAFEMLTDGDEPGPLELFMVWLEAMVANPEAFRRPQAPMSRLFNEADLEARGPLVGPAGFDWDEYESVVTVERVARRWGLDDIGGVAWMIVSKAYERFAADDLPDDDPEIDIDEIWAGIAAMSSYGLVARAFLGEELGAEPDIDGSVMAFAEVLLETASGKARAGPLWLCAVCAERAGQTLVAETFLTQALAADDTYVPALEDAAWYAADRGDARRAASLLRRAGADSDDETLAVYERFSRVPAAQVGRNDRCPCGSGKKYKHCHLANAMLPLSDRCEFLYEKAVAYLQRGGVPQMIEIAATLAGEDDPVAFRHAFGDAIVADLVLFEDGVWDAFLRDRGMLLPADELLLAQQWQLIERSVHEIQAVESGSWVVARDIRTGDVVEVTEHSASRQLVAGELICARIVPDSHGYQFFGGIKRVGLHQRDQLIDLLDKQPSALEVAAWFAAAGAPPRMVNYEHEPVVLSTLTYASDDPDATAAVLDQILEPTNPGEWIETVDTPEMGRTIRGFVRLEGNTLTMETNSEVRADRLRALLEAHLPGLRLLDDVRVPVAEAMADGAAFGVTSDPEEPPEGVEEFMDQFARDYERRWLDMSIPALANLTPRQAADDPTRREDLLALLAEFDRAEPPGKAPSPSMNTVRLRQSLGITT